MTRWSLDAGAHHVFGLEQRLGDPVQARDVVVVVLDGVERDGEREVGEVGVGAALRVDGHLVILQVVVLGAFLEVAQEQVVRGAVFLAEAFGRDGLDADEVGGVQVVAALDGGEGVVAELVVVAVVADGGGEGGGQAQVGLPGVFEQGPSGRRGARKQSEGQHLNRDEPFVEPGRSRSRRGNRLTAATSWKAHDDRA